MQQMDAGQPQQDRSEQGYRGYQPEQEYNRQYYRDSLGTGTQHQSNVKIQPPASDRASAGQRLALAIVSVAILGVLGLAIGTNTAAGLGSYLVLAIIAVAVFLINGFFHRWGVF